MASEIYHVLCRECTHESVTSNLDVARSDTIGHQNDTGHRVVYAQIQ